MDLIQQQWVKQLQQVETFQQKWEDKQQPVERFQLQWDILQQQMTMFNGDTTVSNDLIVNGDVTISSNARLNANIVSLGATLSKLLNIDGNTYTVKKNGEQKIGVLAQGIREDFPELVRQDKESILLANYQGLIPVLINALKEQQKEINRL